MNTKTKKCPPVLTARFSRRIRKWTDPVQAQKMAYRYLGKTAKLYPSDKKEKKYRICDPRTGHYVRFGQIGYEDYTKHKDRQRLNAFRQRNWKWEDAPVYSPRWLSWHLLW